MTARPSIHPDARAFEQALKDEGVQTHHRYAVQVSDFMWWMEGRSREPFSSAAVTRDDVVAYGEVIVRRRPYSRMVEPISMLRRFFRYEQQRGAIAISPVEGLRTLLVYRYR